MRTLSNSSLLKRLSTVCPHDPESRFSCSRHSAVCMRPSTTMHSDVAHRSFLSMTVSLFEKWSKPSARSRAMVLKLSNDGVYDAPWVKWASNDRFCCWQDKCFVSLASTIACGQASSSYREMAALLADMTFPSKMSDTTYSPLGVTA